MDHLHCGINFELYTADGSASSDSAQKRISMKFPEEIENQFGTIAY